jgi:hypothetical protein
MDMTAVKKETADKLLEVLNWFATTDHEGDRLRIKLEYPWLAAWADSEDENDLASFPGSFVTSESGQELYWDDGCSDSNMLASFVESFLRKYATSHTEIVHLQSMGVEDKACQGSTEDVYISGHASKYDPNAYTLRVLMPAALHALKLMTYTPVKSPLRFKLKDLSSMIGACIANDWDEAAIRKELLPAIVKLLKNKKAELSDSERTYLNRVLNWLTANYEY